MGSTKTVIFTRAGHIDPEPRLIKAASWIKDGFNGLTIKAIGWDRTGQSKTREIINDIEIERYYAKGEYGKGFKKNIVGLVLFNIYLFFKFMTTKVDIIHASDLDTVIPAIFACKLKKIKLVYDIYDFYSATHHLGLLSNFVKNIELWAIGQADVVIIPHEKRVEQFGNIKPAVSEKIVVIYNTPQEIITSTCEPNCDVSYVGVLTPDRGLMEVVNAVGNAKNIRITIAGYGVLENQIKQVSKSYSNIAFKGKVSYEDALQIENKSCCILALYDPSIPNNRYAAPNKLCEALMLGKPIITSDGTICADMVRKEGIGFVIPYGSSKELERVFCYIDSNKDVLMEMGVKARLLYQNIYSAKRMSEKLQKVYEELLMKGL